MPEGTSAKSTRVLRSQARNEEPNNEIKAENGQSEDTTVQKNGTESPLLRKRKRNVKEEEKSSTSSEEIPPKKGKASNEKEEKKENSVGNENPGKKEQAESNIDVTMSEPSEIDLESSEPKVPKTDGESNLDPEILENLCLLKNSISLVLTKAQNSKPKEIGTSPKEAWGTLVSPTASISLSGNTFSIGRSSSCNYTISDPQLPSTLLKLHYSKTKQQISIENLGTSNALLLNNRPVRKGSRTKLHDGDTIALNGSKTHAYTVQYNNSDRKQKDPVLSLMGFRSPPDSPENSASSPLGPVGYMTRSRKKNTPGSSSRRSEASALSPSEKAEKESEELSALRKKTVEAFESLLLQSEDIDASFESFPYYLSDAVKQLLINSAFVYLEKPEFVKYLSDLPLSRRILLSGPPGTERYQELLVKALAKHFNARLLILEPSHLEFDRKEKEKSANSDSEEMDELEASPRKESSKSKKKDKKHYAISRLIRQSIKDKGNVLAPFAPIRRLRMDNLGDDGYFIEAELKAEEDKHEGVIIEALLEVLTKDKEIPTILYAKEAETTFANNYDRYSALKKELAKISTPLVVIGSTIASEKKEKSSSAQKQVHAIFDVAFIHEHIARTEEKSNTPRSSRLLPKLLTNQISILPPTEADLLGEWNKKIGADVEDLKVERNRKNLQKILQRNNLECEDFTSPEMSKQIYPTDVLEKVVGWAVSKHLLDSPEVNADSGKLRLSSKALEFGIQMRESIEPQGIEKTLKDVELENEFEKKLLAEVIPPSEIDVKFEDIGALDEVKQSLKELVMLPLQRPELFTKGALTKPCKGILLFGPPGTGKTMLAKAVASQSGANFINVSMSTIASKWFGEGEKYVKGLFTLASKIAPTVIFVDEVDSILGRRERHGEHEAMRKIKNEFMSNWDGLKTKSNERVLVLGATNRPFDLDEAVLRRLSRRLLIDLPSLENRVKILKVILEKEDLESDFDVEALAQKTEGFSGSDLKNLCIAAAYQPIREILDKEKEGMETSESKEAKVEIRSLKMSDFEKSLQEISSSVSEDAVSITELRKWNEMYGEGGSRKKETLPYFL